MTQPTLEAMEKFQQKIMNMIYDNEKCSSGISKTRGCFLLRNTSVLCKSTALQGPYLCDVMKHN